MARSPALSSLVLALSLVASARAEDTEEQARRAQVVVQGEGVEVTVGELEDTISRRGPLARGRFRDPAALKQLAEELAQAELLAQEAERRGYDKNPAVRQVVKDSAAQALVRLEVEDKVTQESIPEADLRAYYDAHQAEFHRPARRRASQLVLESRSEAERLLGEAQKLDARGFSELARNQSKDPASKGQGGDLGYLAREPVGDGSELALPAAVRAAVFALKDVGDTSEVMEVDGRFAILRLTGERPERHMTFEDAQPSIRAKLWREQRQQALDRLIASLRARDKPQTFGERLSRISFDDMEKHPTGFAPEPAPAAPKPAPAAPKPAAPKPVP